jgi:transcriptional regulator with XRE-family HTH domain
MRQIVRSRKVPNRRLQELRINAGLSVNDLARVTQVGAGTIRLAEAGHVPGPRTQFALANYFELRPLDIWPLSQQRVPA